MTRERTNDFCEALRTGAEYWGPLHHGAVVFTVLDEQNELVDVFPTFWKEDEVEQCRGWFVEGSQYCHTHSLVLDPAIIRKMGAEKQYKRLDTSPRFAQA